MGTSVHGSADGKAVQGGARRTNWCHRHGSEPGLARPQAEAWRVPVALCSKHNRGKRAGLEPTHGPEYVWEAHLPRT